MLESRAAPCDATDAKQLRALAAPLLEPAKHLPHRRFFLGGSQYPADFPWTTNLFYLPHVAPPDHPAFYCSSRLTLNVTRAPMVETGWCPSGRIFEASACATPVLSDVWSGIEDLFEPGKEILLAHTTEEAIDWLSRPREELASIGAAARRRTLFEHTGEIRARQLVDCLRQFSRLAAHTRLDPSVIRSSANMRDTAPEVN
ncbi:MAG TPA: glycosyltransferase [Polyangiaceae bacterium]|nr:glycosyltransferase [Polyangiaceae bacterium]